MKAWHLNGSHPERPAASVPGPNARSRSAPRQISPRSDKRAALLMAGYLAGFAQLMQGGPVWATRHDASHGGSSASMAAGSARPESGRQRTLFLLNTLGGVSGPDRGWQPSDKARLQAEAHQSSDRPFHRKEGSPRHYPDGEQAHEVLASLSIRRTRLQACPAALFHTSLCHGRAGWHLALDVANDPRF